MVGAGLLTRSFRAQLAVDTGAELEGVVAMRTQLPGSRFDSDEAIWTFARELEREVTVAEARARLVPRLLAALASWVAPTPAR